MNTDNNTHEYYIRLKESELLMNTHEVRVSLETAKMLQKAGFDWECEYAFTPTTEMGDKAYWYNQGKSHNYNNKEAYSFEIYSAPSLDVAQRWMREVKAIHICVKPNEASANCKYFVTVIVNDTKWGNIQDDNRKTIMFDTYEKALEEGIQKCLTLLLEEK